MHFERTRNCAYGWVEPGEFHTLPDVRFSYGPLTFSIHDLDHHDWRMSFSQKQTSAKRMRGYVRLYPAGNRKSGFTVKLPDRPFESWAEIVRALASVADGIDFHARQELGEGAGRVITEIVEVREPILDALARHNAEALSALGDWRPRPGKEPEPLNVILLERIVAEIKAEAA